MLAFCTGRKNRKKNAVTSKTSLLTRLALLNNLQCVIIRRIQSKDYLRPDHQLLVNTLWYITFHLVYNPKRRGRYFERCVKVFAAENTLPLYRLISIARKQNNLLYIAKTVSFFRRITSNCTFLCLMYIIHFTNKFQNSQINFKNLWKTT